MTKQNQTLKQQSKNVIRKSQKYSGRNKWSDQQGTECPAVYWKGKAFMKKKKKSIDYGKWGLLFILPFFITYLIFSLIPLIDTVRYSFFEYYRSGVKVVGPDFVGMKNYISFLKSDMFLRSWQTDRVIRTEHPWHWSCSWTVICRARIMEWQVHYLFTCSSSVVSSSSLFTESQRKTDT